MSDDKSSTRQSAIAIVKAYPEAERKVLLNWAQQVLVIRSSGLPVAQKLTRIARVTHELGLTKPLLTHLGAEIRRVAWTQRSKPMRGVIGGAGIGLLASVATPMAGVAAFGTAVAIPVVVLGAGAGAVLMAIVDELSSKGLTRNVGADRGLPAIEQFRCCVRRGESCRNYSGRVNGRPTKG